MAPCHAVGTMARRPLRLRQRYSPHRRRENRSRPV